MLAAATRAMRAAGVPVHRLRMEEAPFHASLADINATWDRERGLAAVNAALGHWDAECYVVRAGQATPPPAKPEPTPEPTPKPTKAPTPAPTPAATPGARWAT